MVDCSYGTLMEEVVVLVVVVVKVAKAGITGCGDGSGAMVGGR